MKLFESKPMAVLGLTVISIAAIFIVLLLAELTAQYHIPTWLIPVVIIAAIVIWLFIKTRKAFKILFPGPKEPEQ